MAAEDLVFTVALTDRFTRGMLKIARSTARAGRRMVRAMSRVGTSFVNLRNVMIAAGIGGIAVKMAVDFDTALSRIVGLVGISREQVDAWAEDIKRLAPEVARSPKELAEALFFVTSAGLRGEAAMSALRASAQAAAAGLGETRSVADAVTSAMNAYGQATLSAEKATSILVAAVREGKAGAESLAPVLGRILGVASEVGVSFDQVAAALAAMTRLGAGADEAATSIRAVLVGLLKPSEQGKKALNEMGLSFEGLRRQLREEGLLEVLLGLKERIKDDSDALVAVIPNIRALTGVLNLVGRSADAARAIFARLATEGGEALRVAYGEAASRAGFRFNAALSSLKVTMIELGDALAPLLVKLSEFAAILVDKIAKAGLLEFIERGVGQLTTALTQLATDVNLDKLAVRIADFARQAIRLFALVVASILDLPKNIQTAGITARAELLALRLEILKFGDSIGAMVKRGGGAFSTLLGAIAKTGGTAGATANALLAMASTSDQTATEIELLAAEIEGMRKRAQQLADDPRFVDAVDDQAAAIERLILRAREASALAVAPTVGPGPAFFDIPEPAAVAFDIAIPPGVEDFFLTIEELTQRTLEGIRGMLVVIPELAITTFNNLVEGARRVGPLISQALAAGLTPFESAVIALNQTIVERAAASSLEAGKIYASFLQQATDSAVIAARFVTGTIQQFASAVADFVGRVLDQAFEGQIRTMEDVARIAQDVLKQLIKSVIQELIRLAVTAATARAVAGLGGGAAPIPAGAQGGVVVAQGVPGLQAGGVITREGIFRGGEAGPELVVPLQGGEVPVRITGGGDMGRVTNVNLTIQAMDARDVTRVLTTPEGREAIKANIAETMDTEPEFRKRIQGGI